MENVHKKSQSGSAENTDGLIYDTEVGLMWEMYLDIFAFYVLMHY